MIFKNIKGWTLGPPIAGLLYFAQRMTELLWDFTLDTYKPASLNASSLCNEATDLIDDIEQGLILEKNLDAVLEELIWSVQNDPVAKSLLDSPIEHYVQINSEVKLSEKKLRLEVLGQTLESYRYLERCFDLLTSHVEKVEKGDIDRVTSTMITTLINMGMSKRYLAEKTNEFFFSPGVSISDVSYLKRFLTEIYPIVHNFDLYFLSSSLIKEVRESLPAFKVKILDALPEAVLSSMAAADFIPKKDQVYVHIYGLRSLDVYSAYDDAIAKLDTVSDLFTLFHHRKKISWDAQGIAVQCCVDNPVIVRVANSPMTKAYDLKPDKASRELNSLIKNLSLKGQGFKRFNRVADLHGTCVQSDVPENQLVNLWTSLETLIPSKATSSKINNIINASMPFLLNGYIKRLVQRVSHDLVVWKPWKVKGILNRVEGASGSSMLQRTLVLLCMGKNKSLLDELYSELGDYHLLRFRLFTLNKILLCPEKIREIIASHERKVRWQIHRLYRTRNLIVHSGKKASYLNSLIENGHEYLDQILLAVMKLSCGEYKVRSLEQAFELAKIRHESFARKLAEVSDFSSGNCTFLCDDVDSLPDSSARIWGRNASPEEVIPIVNGV